MALTRKLLESMGIETDKVSTIIDAHAETVDALKAQIDNYKEEAGKLADVQKELEATKTKLAGFESGDESWQKKFEDEHKAFEDFKTEQANKEARTAKETAYKALLREAGISEKRIDSVMKVTDLEAIEMVDGKIKDADKQTEAIKTEWADFISSEETQGAKTPNPPANEVDITKLSEMNMADYIQARSKM